MKLLNISIHKKSFFMTALLSLMYGAMANNYAYIVSAGQNTIKAYDVNSETGVLNSISFQSITTSLDPEDMSVYNNGKNLYTLSWQENKLSLFDINQQTGQLTPSKVASVATGMYPWAISFSPNEKCAYTANYGDTTISQYKVDPNSGELIPVAQAKFDTGFPKPAGVKVSADGKFLFVAFSANNSIGTYAINQDSCGLEPTGKMIVTSANNPLRFARVANYLYVAFGSSNQIGMYKMNADGSLSSIYHDNEDKVDSHGYGLMSLKPSNSGLYLYANNQSSNSIALFEVKADGSLIYKNSFDSGGNGPRSLALDMDGVHAYEVNQQSNTISEFNLDKKTGNLQLKPSPDSAITTDMSPFVICFGNG